MIVYSQEMHSNLSHTKPLEAYVFTIQLKAAKPMSE